jgi:uncharacterized membrane protein HdeD (DUF308 family)
MYVAMTNRWALVLRGVVAIIFGLVAFIWPRITLATLVLLFGAYVLVDGIFAIVAAVRAPKEFARWWVLLIEGVLSILAGIIAFAIPGITALILLGVIAGWAIVTGVVEIVAAIQLRKEIQGEFFLALAGLTSIIFGVLLLWNPAAGALAVLWIIGAYAILFGVLLIALGMKLRGLLHGTVQTV